MLKLDDVCWNSQGVLWAKIPIVMFLDPQFFLTKQLSQWWVFSLLFVFLTLNAISLPYFLSSLYIFSVSFIEVDVVIICVVVVVVSGADLVVVVVAVVAAVRVQSCGRRRGVEKTGGPPLPIEGKLEHEEKKELKLHIGTRGEENCGLTYNITYKYPRICL